MKVPIVTSARLKTIRAQLHNTCIALEELAIPNSLMHSDISPGSIISNESDCVFTDWCETYVGNPFITLEQFCSHAARNNELSASWIPALRNTYRSCWRELLPEQRIDRALRLTPLVSILSHLYGRGDWLSSSQRHNPSFQGYARSLARHMNRIAETLN